VFALFSILMGIGFLVSTFGVGSFFGYTILKPIIKAAHGKKVTTRLYTSDFFSLTLVLVLPTMLMTTFRRTTLPVVFVVVIGVLVYAIAIWIWGRGAIKLSSIGVSSSLKRFVFLGVILPLAILGTAIGVPGLCMGLITTLTQLQFGLALLFASGFLAAALVAKAGKLASAWVLIPDEPIEDPAAAEDPLTN